MTVEASISVLVIDDDPVAVDVAVGHLTGAGIQSRSANSVDEAIAILEADVLPDVILSDVMMPVRDGNDLMRYVRGDERLGHLPFVFLTALGDRDSRIQAIEQGADDLLAKPVDDVEMVARVTSLARLSRDRQARRRRERFDAVIANVVDGMVVTTVDGVIMEANEAARQLLELREERLSLEVALAARGYLEYDDVAGPLEQVRSGRLFRRRVDGHEHYVRVRSREALDLSGVPEAVVHVLRDVTDERRAVRASRLVLNSITHKFRTPLTGIKGALTLLRRLDASSEQRQVIEVLLRSVSRLDQTVLRVVECAEGAATGTGELVDLSPLDRASAAGDLFGTDGIALDDEILAHANVMVNAPVSVPRAPVRAAILEFVANARSAAGEDGAVSLSVVGEADGVRVTVEDDGDGWPAEDLTMVFEPFFQSDRSGQAPGMGLGLALVRHLVELAGGSVVAERTDQGATRFSAWIPAVA